MKQPMMRRLVTTAIVLAGIALASPPSGTAGAAGTGAGGASPTTLGGDGVAVKTPNGASFTLSVSDANEVGALEVDLTRSAPGGDEVHSWHFYSPASSLAFNATTGVGTVTGGTASSPVATIDLTFKAKTHKVEKCSESGSQTLYSGSLSGTAELVTGLSGAGTVGGKSVKFNAKGTSPVVVVDANCQMKVNTCVAQFSFNSPTGPSGVYAAGGVLPVGDKMESALTVSRQVKLSSPANASRVDEAVLLSSKAVNWNAKTHTITASGIAHDVVTGAATVNGGSRRTDTFSCDYSGKKYSVSYLYDENARYWSPPGESLTGHDSIGGALITLQAGKGNYFVTTVSA